MGDYPVIKEIVLVNGEIINDAQLEIDAPTLPGFMAIRSRDLKEATQYLALSSIRSITMKNDEVRRTTPRLYMSPEESVRVRIV